MSVRCENCGNKLGEHSFNEVTECVLAHLGTSLVEVRFDVALRNGIKNSPDIVPPKSLRDLTYCMAERPSSGPIGVADERERDPEG